MRAIVCVFLMACASTVPALPVPSLSPSAESTAATSLVTAFYDTDKLDTVAFDKQLQSALSSDPNSATVREIAMLDAWMRADYDAAFRHALVAAADTSSPFATWFVDELDKADRTVSEVQAAAALLRTIHASHPSYFARAEAAAELASLIESFDERAEAARLISWLAPMSLFSYIGPFDNDQGKGYATVYAPEKAITLGETYQGKVLPVGWRKLSRLNESGALWMDDVVSPAEHAVIYMATFVRTDAERELLLHVRIGSALKVFINDTEVFAEEKLTWGRGYNVVVPLKLPAGWNKVVFKIAEQRSTAFSARFSDPSGVPVSLEASADPQPYAKTVTKLARTVGLTDAIAALSSPGRKAFWQTREVYRSGLSLQVVPVHEALSAAMPGHPLAMYETALAYWENDEVGKAIDLLTKGVERHGSPAFYNKRARFYRFKKQLDKAQRDLEKATALAPRSRLLWMTLADLLEARGMAPDGTRILQRVLAEWPDSDYAMRELGDALGRRGFQDRAVDLYKRLLDLLPGENAIWQKLVDRHIRLEEYADAIMLLETMQERQPMALGYSLQIADLLRRSHEPEEAERLLKRVMAADPDSPSTYQRLAALHDEQNDRPRMLDAFKLALARDPKNTSLRERVDLLEPKGQELAEKFVPSEDDIEAAVAAAATVRIEPGAHVVLLLDQEVTEVARDGSSKRYVSIVAKALDDQGRDALTQTGIPGGNTKLQRAYSVNKRGERQEVSSVQGDSVRFRQLEVGSIAVLQYTWYAPPQTFLPNHFAYGWRFESVHRQHEKSKWTLITPEGMPLSVQVNGSVHQEQNKVEGHDIRVFSAEHVPAVIYEPFMPAQDDLLASVDVSTVQGWDEYVRWERALLAEAFRSSPEIEALAKRLTADAKTPQEKLDRILHFAAREIRYQQEYETTIAGVRPHACPVVIERGYGDCKDKSVLIIKLAKLVGITVEFAILRTTNVGAVKKAIPNQQFNHAIVYVPKQAGFAEGFFMDATTEGLDIGNLRSDDQGAIALVLDAEGEGYRFIDIPYQASNMDYEDHSLAIKVVSETSAEATDTLKLRGASASQLRVMLRNEQVAKKAIEGISAYLFPGSSLKESKPKNHDDIIAPLELKLAMDVSTSLTREGARTRMKIPAQLSLTRTGTLATRKTEIVLGVPTNVTYRYDIALPEGFRVAHLPEAFTISHPCFTAKRTSEAKDRNIKMTLDLQRTCTRIKVSDYPAFREALQKLTNASQQELVFERKQMASNH